jgi:hypothetical protein
MMGQRGLSKIITTASAIAATAALLTASPSALAQKPPADLTVLPPTPTDYTPKKTPWGDWDLTGTWPIENIAATRILFQRQKTYGNRIWVTKEEHDKRVANAGRSDGAFDPEGGLNAGGTQGVADWVKNSDFSWRTSMLVSPADGQLPALTPKAEALYKAGRSGWVPRQDFDWMDDFDSWDRCISRGFPASMFPFRYNYGQRIWQTPGYVVIELEMLGTRVIPLDGRKHWPGQVEAWMGNSRGHWEGKTLVIVTTNIKSGDSATRDMSKRAASPLNMATQNVPPFNTIPTSNKARTVERLTMTGPNAILYEITYDDPEVYTKPWTAQLEWSRDSDYVMPEYACHEGNTMVRNYISASRAHRADVKAGKAQPIESDQRDRFAQQFDFDPVAPADPNAPPPAPRR